MTSREINNLVVVVAFSFSFVVNSIMITSMFTRRSADELVKINASYNRENKYQGAEDCAGLGRHPVFTGNGDYAYCGEKTK